MPHEMDSVDMFAADPATESHAIVSALPIPRTPKISGLADSYPVHEKKFHDLFTREFAFAKSADEVRPNYKFDALTSALGFHGKPTPAGSPVGKVFFRGYRSGGDSYSGDDYRSGIGKFGSGYHFATDQEQAGRYGPSITSISLKPDARVVKSDDLKGMALPTGTPPQIAAMALYDPAVKAALLGYQAIDAQHLGEIVILDRSATYHHNSQQSHARSDDDIFRYADPMKPPAAPPLPNLGDTTPAGPTGMSGVNQTKALGMAAVKPSLGKPAKLPSPLPPDIKKIPKAVSPEVPVTPQVPKDMRYDQGGRERQNPYAFPKQHYTLMVPKQEAFAAAMVDLAEERASRSHPEDIADIDNTIAEVHAAYESDNDNLFTRALSHSIPADTFKRLIHVVDKTPSVSQPPAAKPTLPEFAKAPDYNAEADRRKAGNGTGEWPFKVTTQSEGRMSAAKEAIDLARYAETRPFAPKMSMNAHPTIQAPPEHQPDAKTVVSPTSPATANLRHTLHPEPDRQADAWWHDIPHTNWLRNGQESSRQRLGGGINGAWLSSIGSDNPMSDYHGVWKAADDDQTGAARPRTIPAGNPHGHETAAYEIAHHLGLGDMVPPTVARENRQQIGSMQHFVPGQQNAINADHPFGKEGDPQFPLAAAFDALTMNTDRHMKNWLVDPQSGKFTLIDHGLSFPHTHSQPLMGNSEIFGKANRSGTPVPQAVVQWEHQWPNIERAMRRNGLNDEQIKLTQHRLMGLAQAAKNGETFWQWLKKSGLSDKYYMR